MKNNNLYALRKKHNLTTAEMAETIGISKSYYEKIEYGERNPSYNFIHKIKTTFPDVDTQYLFFNHTECVN